MTQGGEALPTLPLQPAELLPVFAGAIALVSQAIQHRQLDCFVELAANMQGGFGFARNILEVSAPNAVRGPANIRLMADDYGRQARCRVGGRRHERYLTQPDAVLDELRATIAAAPQLPEPRPQWRLQGRTSDLERFRVYSRGFVPVLGRVLQVIGSGIEQRASTCGAQIKAKFSADGQVRPCTAGSQDGMVRFINTDFEPREGPTFEMIFRPAGFDRREQHCMVRCMCEIAELPQPYTLDRYHIRQGRDEQGQKLMIDETTVGPEDIVAMARLAVEGYAGA